MTTTAPTSLSTVIGVFPDYDQADKAIDELRRTNFSYDRIRIVKRGTGGFGDTLKGMFTGQTEVASSTSDNLVKMGMPDYEAQHYQEELDADHVLLLMNADDRPEEAFKIMRDNGAFDLHSRLRVPSQNGAEEPNGSDEEARTAERADAEHNPDEAQEASKPVAASPYQPQSAPDEQAPEDAYEPN